MERPRFHESVRYAWRGIVHTVRTQRNARIHLVVLAAVVAAGLALGITREEWALVLLAAGLVLAAESLNSALEDLADRVEPDFDPHIMRVKDAAAGGVLITALTAAAVGLLVFGPRLLALFHVCRRCSPP